MSSSKFLNFLVNDILDFSQLRSGKFRKDESSFNIKDAIEEILQIQQEKAEFCGINLSCNFENFPVKEGSNSEDKRDLIICTDERRLQ
jgi:signal transduction histidine kinase